MGGGMFFQCHTTIPFIGPAPVLTITILETHALGFAIYYLIKTQLL